MNAAPQRPERLPHPAKVDREIVRLKRLLAELAAVATKLGEEYDKAYQVALHPRSGGEEPPTLGRGHAATDPTGTTATNAQLRQLRWRTTKAARCLDKAIAVTQEGRSLLEDGFHHLDDEEWARWVEKRLAAEGR